MQDRKAQAREVFDLMKTTEDLSIYYRSNKPMYILSMKWFRKWKKYTYFHHITGDHSDKNEEMDTVNNEIIDSLTSDEEEEQEELKHSHPGNIDQDDLLEIETETFLDPEENFNYNNDVLKKGLEENKDYIIVNEKVWKYLNGFYQGKAIRRYVINVNDKDYHLLEVSLKKVCLIKKFCFFTLFIFFLQIDKICYLAKFSFFESANVKSPYHLYEQKRICQIIERKNSKSVQLLSNGEVITE